MLAAISGFLPEELKVVVEVGEGDLRGVPEARLYSVIQDDGAQQLQPSVGC